MPAVLDSRLLRLLKTMEAAPQRTTIEGLMTARTEEGDAESGGRTAFAQTLGAARDLGLVVEDQGTISLSRHGCPEGYGAFADLAHDRLISDEVGDGDAVVLDAYALVAHRRDSGASPGPHWLMTMKREEIADTFRSFIDATRGSSGVGTFNETRLAPWQRWTDFLGLTVPMERGKAFPDLTIRLAREIERDPAMPIDVDVPVRIFLDRILDRMPYLPGGKRSSRLLGPPLTSEVPEVIASSLRELEADGALRLQVLGDAGSPMTLPADAVRPTRSVNSVRIAPA